ncbi:MAG: DUF1365 family protein [Sedimentisphaerales bacterium]|nr:DUF1365 family protein [Sedimentisphaerales bacterium]
MNSQIFTGTVSHGRSWPQRHNFSYPVYFYRFDLDELSELDHNIPGFGYNHFSIVHIDNKDYLWSGDQTLKDKIAGVLDKIGYTDTITKIELVGFAKYLNLTFRPVSFFLCYDITNNCRLVLAEVHNTFGETHLYILKDPLGNTRATCFTVPKAFHVSPFFDINGKYNIEFNDMKDKISITIKLIKEECGDSPVFFARLSGIGQPLTKGNLYRTILKYPFNATLNFPRILRQALTLYFKKKLPVFPKPIPKSEYTMRKQKPSWLARKGMKVLLSFFEAQTTGTIKVRLPQGEIRTLGKASAGRSSDLQIEDYRFFSLLARYGEIGLGIAYEKGYWKSNDLVEFMAFMLDANLEKPVKMGWYSQILKTTYSAKRLRSKNTLSQAKKNISSHYDLSNDMYELFLDETMTYSSAIFENKNDNLADAQIRKIDKILEKACLSKSHHLLEIGSGWGTLAIRAAQKYGCRVTTITLSKEQQKLAQQRINQAGLENIIDVQLCDYREVAGQYDRLISVEMLEAVGKDYYPAFFQNCDRLLKPDGLAVIQTITIPDQRYKTYSKTTDWMKTFIFPGGLLPSLTALTEVLTRHTSFVIKQVESIGPHYALTLEQWKNRFIANSQKIIALGFDDCFIRRWEYYFSYCQAGFTRQYIDDLQIVLTRPRNLDLIAAFNSQTGCDKSDMDNSK